MAVSVIPVNARLQLSLYTGLNEKRAPGCVKQEPAYSCEFS